MCFWKILNLNELSKTELDKILWILDSKKKETFIEFWYIIYT